MRNEKKILGRWNIDYCDKKTNNKIDLSNEDHCGPCGQYILNKTQKHDAITVDKETVSPLQNASISHNRKP
jgi:hypothetical protein